MLGKYIRCQKIKCDSFFLQIFKTNAEIKTLYPYGAFYGQKGICTSLNQMDEWRNVQKWSIVKLQNRVRHDAGHAIISYL